MFPRNNATPPTLAIGSIYLIADGTIQTSGASVRVLTAGGSWGAGGGTLSYDATSGCIYYAPTQAETNGEWFIVAVYKASCTAAQVTVVTSASATTGYAGVDWAKVGNPTTTVNLSGTSTKANETAPPTVQNIVDGISTTVPAGKTNAFGSRIPDAVAGAASGLAIVGSVMGDSAGVGTLLTRVPQIITMAQVGGTGSYYVEALTNSGAAIHASGAAVAKSPATLDWSADVTNKPTIGTSTLSASDVWGYTTRVLTANTNLGLPTSWPSAWPANWNWSTLAIGDITSTGGKIALNGSGYVTYSNSAPPAADAIADAVWDEDTSGHTASGSFGNLIGTTWAAVFSGITSLAAWLRALIRKDTADTTAKTEINTGGGTYDETTDSMEAARDNVDTLVPEAIEFTADDGHQYVKTDAVLIAGGTPEEITSTNPVPADVYKAQGRDVGDVGAGNTAHLLQSADTGATAVARPGDKMDLTDDWGEDTP